MVRACRIRRRMITGAANASSRPTIPVAADASEPPLSRLTAAPAMAIVTMVRTVRNVRRRAPEVCSTNSSVEPLRQTLMNWPIGPNPNEIVMIVSRTSSRTRPKSSCWSSRPTTWPRGVTGLGGAVIPRSMRDRDRDDLTVLRSVGARDRRRRRPAVERSPLDTGRDHAEAGESFEPRPKADREGGRRQAGGSHAADRPHIDRPPLRGDGRAPELDRGGDRRGLEVVGVQPARPGGRDTGHPLEGIAVERRDDGLIEAKA